VPGNFDLSDFFVDDPCIYACKVQNILKNVDWPAPCAGTCSVFSGHLVNSVYTTFCFVKRLNCFGEFFPDVRDLNGLVHCAKNDYIFRHLPLVYCKGSVPAFQNLKCMQWSFGLLRLLELRDVHGS